MNAIKPINILLIDDSAVDALLLRKALSGVNEFEHLVNHATSLSEGRMLNAVHQPDIVILDLNLATSTGIETLMTAKVLFDKPIIVLSGNDDRDVLAQAMTEGAANYIIKGQADGAKIASAILNTLRLSAKKRFI